MGPRPDFDDAAAAAGQRRYTIEGQVLAAPALAPGLYVVATPIGNLRDITLRALQVLAAADLIACEDTRVSRRLLDHYGIGARLLAYHDHNAESARPRLLQRLAEDAAVALISDAGTPLISDPGFKLVRAARGAGHMVTAVPGPSAVMAALSSAGLPTDRFLFEGFLPAKSAARRNRIAELAAVPASLVLFEAGPRLGDTLADLAAVLDSREAAVCRELTKLHEEIRRGDLASLAAHYQGDAEVRGEMVIVVAPPRAAAADAGETETLLRQALQAHSLKDAVAAVAQATGRPRREVYRQALAMSSGDEPAE